MSDFDDRRRFLMTIGTVGCCAGLASTPTAHGANAAPNTSSVPESKAIRYHYDDSFDFGVMKGPTVKEGDFVGKNNDLPTSFFADAKRMRWALQNMSALQTTRRIPRSGEVLEFSYQPIEFDDVRVAEASGAKIGVADWLTKTQTDGFIAVYLSKTKGPLVATEQYFNGLKPDSLHHLWSMSKSLAIGVVAIALSKKRLKRTETVGDILPDLKSSGLGDATLDDVMNMASGGKFFIGDKWTFDGMVEFAMNRAFPACGFLETKKASPKSQGMGWYEFLRTIEKERGHGRAFDYKDFDSRTAIATAEKRLGGAFHDLFTKLVWSRIGAEHDAYICCDKYGSAATPYGFSATLRDCTRWGLMHLPMFDRKILPKNFVENLVNPHPTYSAAASRRFSPTPKGYRDQYWIYPSGKDGGFFAGGWMGQRIHIFPSLSVVIVQLATLWPDNYGEIVPDGPAFLRVAQHVAKTYRRQKL